MARYQQYSNGVVIDTQADDGAHRPVGIVLHPQRVRGINGPAFYRLDQVMGSIPLESEAPQGVLLGKRSLDDVVAEALS